MVVAFHMCGKTFVRPYVALESLAALTFGSRLFRSVSEIAALEHYRRRKRSFLHSEELAKLYDVTLSVFEALQRRDIHAPGHFNKLFGIEYEE